MKLRMSPAHVREEDNVAATVAVVDAVAEGSSLLREILEVIELEVMEEIVEVADVPTNVASSVEFGERLNAIIACRSKYYEITFLLVGNQPPYEES